MTSSTQFAISKDRLSIDCQLPIGNVVANRQTSIATSLLPANCYLLIAGRRTA